MNNSGIDNFDNLSDYIKFYAKFVHEKHEIRYERYNGQFYWVVNGDREEKPAFSIGSSKDEKGNVIGFKLVVHRMPKQNNNNRVSQEFGVQLAGVPIDKAKLAKNTSGYLYNHATVEYNEGKEHISGSSKIPTEVANNLSKSGKLCTDFHSNPDNRKIDWTVAFNQRGWLADEKSVDKLLKEDGITFTDTVGADKAWGKDEKASTSLLLQDIKQAFKKGHLTVSLGKMSSDSTKIIDSQILGQNDFNIEDAVESSGNQQAVKSTIKFSDKAVNLYKDGYSVIVLRFSSNVKRLETSASKKFEHLKGWEFASKLEIARLPNEKKTVKSSVTYLDTGFLLDKDGILEEDTINGEKQKVLKWNLIVNGEGKTTKDLALKATDEIQNDHHKHLETLDDNHRLKVYQAKRDLVTKGGKETVEYSKGALLDSDNYELKYANNLRKMEIQFAEGIGDKHPLMVEYYTVVSRNVAGITYENNVTLEVGSETFTQGKAVKSNTSAGAEFDHFSVRISKKDLQTSDPITGVIFGLEKRKKGSNDSWEPVKISDSGDRITAETNDDGIATFYGLGDVNKYKVVELKGAHGYDDVYESDEFTSENAEDRVYNIEAFNSKKRQLQIKKTLTTSDPSLKDQLFEFQVEATDGKGETDADFSGTYQATRNDTPTVDVSFTKGVSKVIKLKPDENYRIWGLSNDQHYRVTELGAKMFDTAYDISGMKSGDATDIQGKQTSIFQLKEDANSSGLVHFTNRYARNQFEFEKTVEGADSDDLFEFDVTAGNEDTADSVKSKKFDVALVNATTGASINDDVEIQIEFDDDGESAGLWYGDAIRAKPIKLEDNQRLIIKGLPEEVVKFVVKENVDEAQWATSNQVDGEDEVVGPNASLTLNRKDAKNSIVFRNMPVGQVPFKLQKTVGRGIPSDKEFLFTLTIKNQGLNWGSEKEFKADKTDPSDKFNLKFVKDEKTGHYVASEKLKANQILTVMMPKDLNIEILETNVAGYEVTYSYGNEKGEGDKHSIITGEQNKLSTLIFNNDTIGSELAIEKKLKGTNLTSDDHEKKFEFDVQGSDKEGRKLKGIFDIQLTTAGNDNLIGTVTFTDGKISSVRLQNRPSTDKIVLKSDEQAKILELPVGAEIKAIELETSHSGYTPSYVLNTNDERSGNETIPFVSRKDMPSTVKFVNTKDGEAEMGSFNVNKFVNEVGDRSRAFNFHLEAVDGAGNPLDGSFHTVTTTNGTTTDGFIHIRGGNASFTLRHGQTIKFILPMGARYEVSEVDYTKDGYTTTVTKRNAPISGTTVTGTATADSDTISYHNDLEVDEGELPLPADEDKPDSSATIDEPDALPASDGTSGKNGTSGITSPQGLPSAGYTGKQALPQTGEDDGKLFMIIGVIILVMVAVAGTIYYTKRKQVK